MFEELNWDDEEKNPGVHVLGKRKLIVAPVAQD